MSVLERMRKVRKVPDHLRQYRDPETGWLYIRDGAYLITYWANGEVKSVEVVGK
jgi:hypothetical protein